MLGKVAVGAGRYAKTHMALIYSLVGETACAHMDTHTRTHKHIQKTNQANFVVQSEDHWTWAIGAVLSQEIDDRLEGLV